MREVFSWRILQTFKIRRGIFFCKTATYGSLFVWMLLSFLRSNVRNFVSEKCFLLQGDSQIIANISSRDLGPPERQKSLKFENIFTYSSLEVQSENIVLYLRLLHFQVGKWTNEMVQSQMHFIRIVKIFQVPNMSNFSRWMEKTTILRTRCNNMESKSII